MTISIFPNYQLSFPTGKSDEVRYHTVPLSYLPPLGLGTWQLPKSKAAKIVKVALEKGYRHIDAAMIYGE
jgi:diketogulonate reductase-like aldo/keto reductase